MKAGAALAIVLALAAAAGALEWHGHHRGYDDGVAASAKLVQQARQGQRDAEQTRDDAYRALTAVRLKLDAQAQDLRDANAVADAALAERNRLQKQYDTLTKQRQQAVKDTAHASPDCAELARLPVCAAVAGRLWGQGADDPPAAGG